MHFLVAMKYYVLISNVKKISSYQTNLNIFSLIQIGRYRTLLSHSSCIWDVSLLLMPKQKPTLQLINERDCLRDGAFATCSADGSIRLWNLSSSQDKSIVGLNGTSPRPPNIYSKDVLGVLYIGEPFENPIAIIL